MLFVSYANVSNTNGRFEIFSVLFLLWRIPGFLLHTETLPELYYTEARL